MKTKFVLNWVCLFALLFASAAWSDVRSLEGNPTEGFFVNMSTDGDDVLTITEADIAAGITTFTVYDDGGENGDYSEYILHSCLSLVSPVGYRLELLGTRNLENDDNLWIHDGSVSEPILLDKISGSGDIDPVTSTGNSVTVCFESDILWSFSGFAMTVNLVEAPELHNISVIGNVEHGSVVPSVALAQVGEKVSLTVAPDNGYYLRGFSVQDEDEKVLYTYDAWYRDDAPSFAMPYADVSVVPVFVDGLTAENGLYITTPYKGIDRYSIPENVVSFHIYDDGGVSEVPTEGATGSVELTAPENYRWVLTGNLATHDYSNGMTVYDGVFSSSYLVHDLHSFEYGEPVAIDTIVSSGRVMTVRFQTYTYGNGGFGLDLNARLIDARPHSITVEPSNLGEIRCDESATYGTEVTFWAIPENGAELVSVSAIDSDGKLVPLTRGGGLNSNRFSFAMREKPVTITPVFANENVVTFDENGCLTNGTYFHLECSGENTKTCSLSQGIVENPNENVTDFKCFYSTSANTKGVVNAFNEIGGASLELKRDLNLGGYVDGRCAMSAFAPFDLVNPNQNRFNGNKHTVKGFCYDGNAENVAFLLNGHVSDVTFDSAHVVANNTTNGSRAGVVVGFTYNGNTEITNVHVKNSYVSGTQAGAIAGSSVINSGTLKVQNSSVTDTEVHGLPPSGQGVTISAAGGLVGFAHNLETTSDSLTNVSVTGAAKMGGVVGYVDAYTEDVGSRPELFIYDVRFSGSVGKSCRANSSIGGLVGEVGNPGGAGAVVDIKRSMVTSATGPIVYEDVCNGVTLQNANVGGFVGYVSDAPQKMSVSIEHSASIGDIAVSGTATSSVGYIIGAMMYSVEGSSAEVYYNYHYGNDAVALGVGKIEYPGSDEDANSIAKWKLGYNTNRCYFDENVRNGNATNGLETDGSIGPYEYLIFQAEGYFHYMFKHLVDENGVLSAVLTNGVASDDEMKSGKFAAALNFLGGVGYWTWSENLNEGLPSIINSSTGKPIYYLYLSIYDYGTDGSGIYVPTIDAAKMNALGIDTISWNHYDSDNIHFSMYGIAGYTDASGHADADFVKHYQNIVNDIAATNTASYSLVGETVNGEYLSRISPITDTTVFTGQSRYVINIREKRTYDVEYEYCVDGGDEPDNCSPVDEAEQTIVFLSPQVDSCDNSKDFALVPSAIALGGTVNGNLETRILGMTEDNVQISNYQFSTEFVLFGDVIGEFSRYTEFSRITKIVVRYYAEDIPHQKAVVKNPSGAEFDFYVKAYNATNGTLQMEEISPVVSETEWITVPYGVTFAAGGFFDNRVGYKYDSYSLIYKVENGFQRVDYSTYNPCGTIDAADTLEVDGWSFPSYQQLYQDIGDCQSKTFMISGLGENDEVDLQNVKLAKNFFSQYMTDTFSVVPKYNPVEYTITFNTNGWQYIYGAAADDPSFVPGAAKYEMYIAKDFNSPATYNLDLKNKKLPIFHAVTQELDDASAGFNAYVVSWVYNDDKINCEVGTSGEGYECIAVLETGSGFFDEISENLISEVTEAEKMGGVDMNRSFTLYPVWSGTSDERSFILVDCETTRDYDCVEPPVTLELSQSFTMSGQRYTLRHQADSSFMGNASIPIPSGRSSEYEFDVNVSAKPGFEVNLDGIYFDTDSSKMNRYISYDAENRKLYVDGRSNESLKIFMKNSGYSLKDYTVNLDLSGLPEDAVLIVGDGFDSLRTMNLSATGRKMHAFVKRGRGFYPLVWAAVPNLDASPEANGYMPYYELSSGLIAEALGNDPDKSAFTVYAQEFFMSSVSDILVLLEESDYGRVLFSQTVGGKTSVIYPEEIHYSSDGEYGLLLPAFPVLDTMTFQIVLDPKPGYGMTIVECGYGWTDMPANEDWGCNEDKTQFRYTSEYMANYNYIDVRYDTLHYNIDFAMAETENGKDVYVPNKYADGNYEMMQYEGLRDVTFETVQTPFLLDAEGCQVGWKVKGREVEERDDPSIVYEMPFMKAMAGNDDTTTNTLVPDGEFRFCNDDTEYYTLKLVVEGPGTLEMVQKVGNDPVNEGDPEPVYVHHAFKTDDSVAYLKIPVVRDGDVEVGVKLMPVAIPEDGSFLKEITYNAVVGGNEMTVVMDDSASINIMQNQVWHVKFEEYKPLQVTYNLSLGAADSSNVWIPTDGMNEGTIALGENESATAMWKPYRSDSCFAGWSMLRSSERTDDDVIYMALDKDNYEDFSSIGVNRLYAVWMPYGEDCARPTVVNSLNLGYFEGGKPNALVLMDRSDTLVVTQKFGDVVITHRVDSFDNALAYNPAGYDISVRIEMGVSYAPDAESPELLAYAKQGNSDGTQVVALEGENGVFRVGNTTSSLSYYFGQKEHEIRYNFVYNVNAGGANVFYGDNWSSTAQKSLNDSSVAFPKNIYRSDACLMGWSKDAKAKTGARELTLEFVETLDATKSVDTLYAVWNECDVNTYTVSFANTNIGSLVLTQDVEDTIVSFDVGEDGLDVPVVEGGLKFRAAYTLKPGYRADSDSLYLVNDADGSLTTLVDNSFTVEGNMTFTVPSDEKIFTLVFDVNRSGNVFYGTDWAERKSFRLTESVTSIPLPQYAYTSDRCMVGWSLAKSGKKTYLQFTGDLVDALQELGDVKDSYKMYAIWGEGNACDELYDRITLSGKNGTVRLAETESGDMENAVLHDFVNDGSMLLPKTMNGNSLRIVSVPDSSFVLDSLVMTRNGSVERQAFREGNALAFNLSGVNLEMFFGKSNTTEIDFVEPEFAKTGNAIRFTFSTTMFEVTRKASARVRLETIGGDLVDEATISDSIVPPYRGVWEKFPLDAGRYILTVTIGDAKQSKEYVTVFDVFAEIASLATENAWRMISIGNLDKESFVWDGDAKFYWWDESNAMGEYWQYREYRPSDDIVATRGYWYGSVEGRPLMLKTENDRTIEKNIVWKLDSVNSGWNMVANPYGFALDLFADHPAGNVEATENTGIRFLRWDPNVGSYRETDALEPYEAVWVEVSHSTEWTIPVVPDFTNKSGEGDKHLGKRLAKAIGLNDWRIQAVLADAKGHRDSWNMLGASSRPFAAGKPPEGMGDHVSLSIMDDKRTLAKSVKAPAEEQEWTIRLNASSERLGNLSFEGVDELNALGLKVFVTVDGKTTEMREGTDLKVALGPNGKYASVRVAKSAKVVADLHIDGVHFTQAGRTLDVSFNASADLAGSRAVVDVLNMDGKVVASKSGKALAGMNALTLETPRGGVYMLRVRAGSQMKVSRILVK